MKETIFRKNFRRWRGTISEELILRKISKMLRETILKEPIL
jgi:hypothetical protein